MSACDPRGWGHLSYGVVPPLLLEGERELFGFIDCFTDGCFCPVRLSSPYGGIRRAHFGDWMNLTPTYWTQSGHRCRTKTRSRRVRNAPDSAGQTGTGYPYPRPLVLAQKCGRYVYRSFHPNNMLRTISPTMIPFCYATSTTPHCISPCLLEGELL